MVVVGSNGGNDSGNSSDGETASGDVIVAMSDGGHDSGEECGGEGDRGEVF